MPKLVDPQQRRMLIADAVFDALREGGFEKVTLANVAERAGLAVGSVRHFLGTRAELIAFAFDTMVDRISARITSRVEDMAMAMENNTLDSEQRLTAVTDMLCELIPLDQQRRDEAIVWLEFETAARTDPNLSSRSDQAAHGTHLLIERILAAARRSGALSSSVDFATERVRLSALIDGLTLHRALHPDMLDPGLARHVLIDHLRRMRV